MVPALMSIVDMAAPLRCTFTNRLSVRKLPTGCMEIKRRTQEERSAATRHALISAARGLWGQRGYAEVGTPEIAKEAGVTRGAMYHQFADKAALFSAVDAWLEVSADPEVRQLILLDAPSVLGWPAFRDVAQRYSLGMTEQLITEAVRAGQLAPQPMRPLAHVLIGALDEAAMVIATADDPKRARREAAEVLHR